MSFCLGTKFLRVVPGLAIQTSHQFTSTRARRPEQTPMQLRALPSRIPVPSPRKVPSFSPSSSSSPSSRSSPSKIALPATSPTLSRKPAAASTSSSRKTEDSIAKHVERLRKVQAAKSTFKTSASKAAAFKAESKAAQPRPVSRPASRVPSTHSVVSSSSSSSSVVRTEASIDAHIQRVTKARASCPNSARSSPATSRRVTPIQPLLIKKKTVLANVDLAMVDAQLANLSVAPSPSPAKADKPSVPTLPSCMKKTSAGKSTKSVHFVEFGGWQCHGLRVYTPDSCPTSFFDLRDLDYDLFRPPPVVYKYLPTNYALFPNGRDEMCWPPDPWEPYYIGHPGPGVPPPSCLACHVAASGGTPHTRSHADMQTIRCSDCWASPSRRKLIFPALDISDDDPGCSSCPGPHEETPETCQIYQSSYRANINWLYDRYPERYDLWDALLAS